MSVNSIAAAVAKSPPFECPMIALKLCSTYSQNLNYSQISIYSKTKMGLTLKYKRTILSKREAFLCANNRSAAVRMYSSGIDGRS